MRYFATILLLCFLNQSLSVDRLNYAKKQTFLGLESYKNCQYSEAIDYYISALHSLDSIVQYDKTDSLRGVIYQNIGDILSDCDKFESSKEKYFKSLELSLKADDSINIANCYRKIGNLCYYLSKTEKPDTLLYYMQKSLPYAKNEDPYYAALYITLISVIKEKITFYDFMPARIKGITLLPNEYNDRLPYLENYIAWALGVVGEYEKAIQFAQKSSLSNDIKQKITATELLSKLYLEKCDTTAAILSIKTLDSLNMHLEEAKRKAAGIEFALRKYENEITEKNNSISKYKTVTIVAAVILIIFVLFLIIKKTEKTRKNKIAISDKWHDFKSSEIVHHILEKCDTEHNLTATNVSTSLICLTENEKKELEQITNECFNCFIEKFMKQYPEITHDELYYVLLSLINISEVQKAALLGMSYQGSISRRNRIIKKTGMTNLHNDLCIYLKNIV